MKPTTLAQVLKIWASHSVETLVLELNPQKNKLIIKTRQNNQIMRNKILLEIQLILGVLLLSIMNLRKTCFLVSTTGPMLKVQLFCQHRIPKTVINKSNQFSNRKITSVLLTLLCQMRKHQKKSTWEKLLMKRQKEET